MKDKLKPPVDISYVNKRVRQQSVVDLLQEWRDRADRGEVVGVALLALDSNGVWRDARDLFSSDMPTLLGYLGLMKHRMEAQYLDGGHEEWDTDPTG